MKMKLEKLRIMDYEKAVSLLKKHRIPVAKQLVCKSEKELLKASKKLKFPVALKALSPKIIHKTEFGAVVLNIRNSKELLQNYSVLIKKIKQKKIRFNRVLVQEMIKGREVMIGMKYDAQFGPVVLFALGGVLVEVLNDVAFRVAPISVNEAKEMMAELKGYSVLTGVRGKKGVNIKVLSEMIASFSRMVMKLDKVSEIDLNPVIVNSKEALVVDARIMVLK
jgi:acyl-CoA synthetase (NDP forming)